MSEHSTLSDLFRRFDASSVTQGTTRAKCRSSWNALMQLVGRNFRADEVTSEHIAQFQRHLRDEAVSRFRKGFSEHTVFSYVAAIGQVFRWAAHPDRRYVESNPVLRCDRMKPTKKKVHIYTHDEISDMLDTVRGNRDTEVGAMTWPDAAGVLRWTGFFLVALTGPREGEIWNMRWDDIDLDAGAVKIQSRSDRVGEYWKWTAKGKSERIVPMSDDLWALFYRLKEVAPWRYPFLKQETCIDKQANVGQLSEFQRKYPYNNFHREFKSILARTNARRKRDDRPEIVDGKFHTLRKNTATMMAEKGVPSHFTQEILGHATDRLTKEVYTFVDQHKCLDAARQAFNSVQY